MSQDFWETTYPTASKQYQCLGCLRPIAKGEKHSHCRGVFGGEWQSTRLHMECAQALQESNGPGSYEFTPGECEPPERLNAAHTKGSGQ